MAGEIEEPRYGTPDEENPEWTEEDFRRARKGAPWNWDQAHPLRDAADALRREADRLDARAAEIDPYDRDPRWGRVKYRDPEHIPRGDDIAAE